jgi:septum formation protein
MKKLKDDNVTTDKLILTSDQIVLYEQTIREKPISKEEAYAFLSSYSNKSVSTVSSIVITHYPTGLQYSGFDIVTIHWKEITDEIIEKVIEKGDIFNCSGGFAIEDNDLSQCIHSVDGPFDSVLGVPINLTVNLMAEVICYLEDLANNKGTVNEEGKLIKRYSKDNSLDSSF